MAGRYSLKTITKLTQIIFDFNQILYMNTEYILIGEYATIISLSHVILEIFKVKYF